jgi:hypothetical protein
LPTELSVQVVRGTSSATYCVVMGKMDYSQVTRPIATGSP